jgi:hypothetical protein
MVPVTPEQVRKHVRGWPAGGLRKAIRAALPELDTGMEPLKIGAKAGSGTGANREMS